VYYETIIGSILFEAPKLFGGDLGNALGKVICKYYVSKCLGSGDMKTGSTGSQK